MTGVSPGETRLQPIRLLQESRGLGEVILRVGEVGPSNASSLSLYVAGTSSRTSSRLGVANRLLFISAGRNVTGRVEWRAFTALHRGLFRFRIPPCGPASHRLEGGGEPCRDRRHRS